MATESIFSFRRCPTAFSYTLLLLLVIPLIAAAGVSAERVRYGGRLAGIEGRAEEVSFSRGSRSPDGSISARGGGSSAAAIIEGLKNGVASGLASAAAKTLLQPFDTIKTVQQQHHSDGDEGALSLFDAARMLIDRGGVLELYAGLAVSALGSVPSIGIYYGFYSYGKRMLIPFLRGSFGSGGSEILSDDSLKLVGVAMAAALGNTIASFSRVPYEVVKQKLMVGHYRSTYVAISSMFKAGGLKAFFPMGGVAVQMMRDIPYAVFTLLAYEVLRDEWVTKSERKEGVGSPWRDMAAGAAAGGFGTAMTNGLDVVKTNLQTDPELYGGSILACARALYDSGGPAAFARGIVPRLMHKIPANAMFFLFYEAFRRVLKVEGSSSAKETEANAKAGR